MADYLVRTFGIPSAVAHTILISGLILLVLIIVAGARILHKAGDRWWKILIPVYGSYSLYKAADSTDLFWGQIALTVATNLIARVMAQSAVRNTFYLEKPNLDAVYIVYAIAAVIGLIITWIFCIKLAEAFGKGKLFAVGLLLLTPVFYMILAFGSAQHWNSRPYEARSEKTETGGSENSDTVVRLEETERPIRRETDSVERTTVLENTAYTVKLRLICSGQYMDTSVRLREGEKAAIGSGNSAQIRTNPADTGISERHGIFAVSGGKVTYTDCSRGGSRYNGQRILHQGESIALPFNTKSQIEMGKHKVLVIVGRT